MLDALTLLLLCFAGGVAALFVLATLLTFIEGEEERSEHDKHL